MLPFLKKNHEASVSMSVDSIKREHDEDKEFDEMEYAAEDLIDAVHKKDAKAVAEALKAAFEICESYPHEEGEHV